jgi:hypothetical protein
MTKNKFSLTSMFWHLVFRLYDIAEAMDRKKENGNKK